MKLSWTVCLHGYFYSISESNYHLPRHYNIRPDKTKNKLVIYFHHQYISLLSFFLIILQTKNKKRKQKQIWPPSSSYKTRDTKTTSDHHRGLPNWRAAAYSGSEQQHLRRWFSIWGCTSGSFDRKQYQQLPVKEFWGNREDMNR